MTRPEELQEKILKSGFGFGEVMTYLDSYVKIQTRPEWDDYFMTIAEVVATRGTCPRKQVGAVIVDEKKRIIATGYNGAPSKLEQCDEVGCKLDSQEQSCVRTLHAECNAILHADSNRLSGATLYTSGYSPCLACAKIIIVSGIKLVVFQEVYSIEALHFLTSAGVNIRKD